MALCTLLKIFNTHINNRKFNIYKMRKQTSSKSNSSINNKATIVVNLLTPNRWDSTMGINNINISPPKIYRYKIDMIN